MKKNIIIPIVAAVMAAVVAVGAAVVVQRAKRGIWHEWSSEMYFSGGSNPNVETKVINSIEEFSEMYGQSDPYDGKYNEEFFERKALVIFKFGSGSTAPQFAVSKVSVNGNVLNVEVSKYAHRYGAQVLTTRVLIVEVKKKDIKDVSEVKIEFLDTGYRVDA